MFRATNGKLTPGMVLRIIADGLMVLCSLLVASSLTWLCHVLIDKGIADKSLAQQFWMMIGRYAEAAWPLTIICVAVFYLNGFYTYGRFYQGRYKALIIFQAVCQSYLAFGFLHYGFLGGAQTLPRSALILSWIISLMLIIGSRLWLQIWKKIADPERERILGEKRGRGRTCS